MTKGEGWAIRSLMKSIFSHFKKLDWILIIVAFLLVTIGLLSIYSSSLNKGDFLSFKKQIIFFVFGLFLIISLSFFDWRILKNDPYLILILYFLCLLGLFGLFFFGKEIRGTRGWYKFGPFSLDPIEPIKLALLILLAKYFSKRHVEMYRVKHILLSGFYILIPSVLIFFQPDIGSILILISLWIGILVISGIKLKHFLILCFLGILIFSLAWSTALKDYQKQRVISFFLPQIEPLGVGWSQQQSKIAIGSGGILGQGFTKGSQTQYGFLPEPKTDFIFASIAEEFGFIGISFLLILFSLFIWRVIRNSLSFRSNFSRIFGAGFAILIFSQIFVNIAMNLGILPIIGIPLPFVSYGGSNLIAIFIGLGILQSMRINNY